MRPLALGPPIAAAAGVPSELAAASQRNGISKPSFRCANPPAENVAPSLQAVTAWLDV
jgi:hypothetical protein